MGRRRRRAAVAEGRQGDRVPLRHPRAPPARRRSRTSARTARTSSETIAWVRVYDRETDRVEVLDDRRPSASSTTAAAVFKYRDPLDGPGGRLPAARESDESGPLQYAELCAGAGHDGGRPRAAAPDVREAVLGLRRGKGMVIDHGDPDSVSAGSFFTNPILDHDAAEAPRRPARVGPSRTAGSRRPAAWLIERVRLPRGYGDGRAGISSKHTLALVNRGVPPPPS